MGRSARSAWLRGELTYAEGDTSISLANDLSRTKPRTLAGDVREQRATMSFGVVIVAPVLNICGELRVKLKRGFLIRRARTLTQLDRTRRGGLLLNIKPGRPLHARCRPEKRTARLDEISAPESACRGGTHSYLLTK